MNQLMRKKKIFLVILSIIVIGLLLYKNGLINKDQFIQSKVQRKTLNENLTLSGTIDASEKVTLQFQTSGRLSYVGIKEGDYVKKNQLIASLDQRELKKNLQKYLNTFSKSRIDLDQSRDDYENMAINDSMKRVLDKTQFSLDNSILDVELQDLSLKYANLYTPIEGLVTKVSSPYPGVNIIPASATFEIINPKTINFTATADQSEVIQIKEGMPGNIVLDSFHDKEIPAIVKTIAFTPKSGETGTVYSLQLDINISNDTTVYRIGMTGDVVFTINSKTNVLSIPVQFVKEDKLGNAYVYVLKEGKKVKRKIKAGIETEDDIEIISGLEDGENIYD